MDQADITCEVLVVGAGPTGLMAANLLKLAGVDVRIVDLRSGPSRESRAFAVSARSLELFASIGLADRLIERGAITSGVDFHVSGRRVGGLDYDKVQAPDTPFPFILMVPQSETEAVLIDALGKAGLEVEREIEVTGLDQASDQVRVTARRADGAPVAISARYVLGADGAHSIVRRALDLSFEGAKYPQSFLLGDVEVDWPLGHGRFRLFMQGERIGLFFPLQGTRLSRVMTTDLHASDLHADAPHAGDDPSHPEPLALEELQASFAEATGQPASLRNPTWLTRFRTHHRVVDRYRAGRVFVAGDAAHIHSPAGGQGMNTGLQDAANLAWKLAWKLGGTMRADAGEAMLDTYETERLPVARQVLRMTDRMFTVAAGQSGWRAHLRDLVAPAVLAPASGVGAIQTAVFRRLEQIDIRYPPSCAVAPGAGMRAPAAQLSRHRDLLDVLAGYRFHLLVLSRGALEADAADGILGRFAAVSALGVEPHLLTRQAGGRRDGIEIIERGDVFDRYGVPPDDGQASVLIRPDGHIAWRGDGVGVAGCMDFLTQSIGLAGSGRPDCR
ncbi:FAD-dependent monooxygenase [Azospirillum picis]|uniref:2-polyprenyl-6-methoxyphenol hydroxylase-like FAD-dependent oxidoreductase n=1 Tax=Azospirillum picis TaxID=488438 RepID=A0ABU0MD64_9PROT|nr:FAD-dependent monooxygenase [Azospirillum picis]MBP2297609.1 2-polyprenyl-6-methoxyphenol hydroxylase-like FAD-dependent oxidoreductase [Azospirillum picis]MDQ0531368.1 2-polyprenyl-6-methoxyphenol hydroxylase-like FAD-dependent oxidoreductase [Azospirillum picis]